MPASSNTISSTASSDLLFSGGGRVRPLELVRRRGSRGLRLSVSPSDARVTLTLPPRAAAGPAIAWARDQRGWVEERLAALPPALPIVPGLRFQFGDGQVMLDWSAARPRTPVLDGERLLLGGPRDTLAPRLLRFIRAQALALLVEETRALAWPRGLPLGQVSVGDPASRWGSCAANGNIRYSWRIILAPRDVRRSIVAHEVAHLIHLNHSPAFHAEVRMLMGADPAPARRWLRAHGASLHWFGRAD